MTPGRGMLHKISRERPIQHRQVDSPEASPRVSLIHFLHHCVRNINHIA
jgi:hypothetical protein